MSSRHSSFDASASDVTTTSDDEIESDIETSGEGDQELEGDEEDEEDDDGETQHMVPGRGMLHLETSPWCFGGNRDVHAQQVEHTYKCMHM